MEPFNLATLDLLTRWYRLRQQGKLFPLLQEWSKLWRFDPVGRWEDRWEITIDELRREVEREERSGVIVVVVEKKDVGVERRESGIKLRA